MANTNTTTSNVNSGNLRPALPFSVDYIPVGTSDKRSIAFGTQSGALKHGLEMARNAATGIVFKRWDNGTWVQDDSNMKSLTTKLQGNGNSQAVASLTQLNELTNVLIKKVGKMSGPIDEQLVQAWLSHFWYSAHAMNIPTQAIEQTRGTVPHVAQGAREGQRA